MPSFPLSSTLKLLIPFFSLLFSFVSSLVWLLMSPLLSSLLLLPLWLLFRRFSSLRFSLLLSLSLSRRLWLWLYLLLFRFLFLFSSCCASSCYASYCQRHHE